MTAVPGKLAAHVWEARRKRMELTQLRYFLQVYRLKNICSASARLNVTQQAVSKQIRKLRTSWASRCL